MGELGRIGTERGLTGGAEDGLRSCFEELGGDVSATTGADSADVGARPLSCERRFSQGTCDALGILRCGWIGRTEDRSRGRQFLVRWVRDGSEMRAHFFVPRRCAPAGVQAMLF